MTSGVQRRVMVATALALALGGCSVGTSQLPPETVSIATPHGLSARLAIATTGGQRCTTATYRSTLADGRPVLQGSRSCARALPGHPVLIQASTSPESLLLDVSATGCGTVRGGPTRAATHPLASRCSLSRPELRVTILPPARRTALLGVPGAPVINFPRHRCTIGLCITPLA